MKFQVFPEAKREGREAATWYDDQQPVLPCERSFSGGSARQRTYQALRRSSGLFNRIEFVTCEELACPVSD